MSSLWRPRFGAFRARYLIIAWAALVVYLPGFDWLLERVAPDAPSWLELLIGLYWYNLLLVIVIGVTLWRYRISLVSLFGERGGRADYRHGVLLTTFVFLFSVVGVYALFFPLSLVAPDLVSDLILTQPDVIIYTAGAYPLWPNLCSVAAMCVITPVIEECVFRGILLHRWSVKWTLKRAVIASSILFGVMHADPIGATAFGLAMAWLYLRTQSLWVPIVCHGLNNFGVWLLEAYSAYRDGPLDIYTLADFYGDWPWAAWSAILCLLMAWYALRRRHRVILRLPLDVGVPATTVFGPEARA